MRKVGHRFGLHQGHAAQLVSELCCEPAVHRRAVVPLLVQTLHPLCILLAPKHQFLHDARRWSIWFEAFLLIAVLAMVRAGACLPSSVFTCPSPCISSTHMACAPTQMKHTQRRAPDPYYLPQPPVHRASWASWRRTS